MSHEIIVLDFDCVLFDVNNNRLFPNAIHNLQLLRQHNKEVWILTARQAHTQGGVEMIQELRKNGFLGMFRFIEIGCLDSNGRVNKGEHLLEMCLKYGIENKDRIYFFEDQEVFVYQAKMAGFKNSFLVNPDRGIEKFGVRNG